MRLGFSTASQWVSWATEVLSSTEYAPSLLQKMMGGPGSGVMSKDEARDVALTVAMVVNRVPSPAKELYLYMYGHDNRGEYRLEVCAALARQRYEHRARRHILRTRIFNEVVKGHRRFKLENIPLGMYALANRLGVSNKNLKQCKWPGMVREVRKYLDIWIFQADAQITDELVDKGFIGDR